LTGGREDSLFVFANYRQLENRSGVSTFKRHGSSLVAPELPSPLLSVVASFGGSHAPLLPTIPRSLFLIAHL
jgi:hypothetical protein